MRVPIKVSTGGSRGAEPEYVTNVWLRFSQRRGPLQMTELELIR